MHTTPPLWPERPVALTGIRSRLVACPAPIGLRGSVVGGAIASGRGVSRSTALRLVGTPGNGHALRMQVDPGDAQRTRISGRMSDVCDALDALVSRQAAA